MDEFAPGQLSSGQPNLPIYDVASIEVLRGPQGVFFGRNSEGGAINIVTNKPGDEFFGRIDAGIGRFQSYELSGVINIPVSETLFARLTVQGTKTDGPLKNAHPVGGDTGAEFLAVRGQIRWQPSENTTVDLAVNHTTDNQEFTPKIASCINAGTFGLPIPVLGDDGVLGGIGCYDAQGEFSSRVEAGEINLPTGLTLADIPNNKNFLYQDTREHTDIETEIYTLKIEHNLTDTIAFTSVTGAARSDMDQFLDLDKSGIRAINRFGLFSTDSWSQEVRLSQVGASKLDWTVGGITYRESFNATNQILIEQVLGPWVPGDIANENQIHNVIKGYAAFANVEFHVTDALSLIAGARYSHDKGTNEWDEVYAACGRRAPGAPLSEGCELRPEQEMLLSMGSDLPQFSDRNGGFVVSGGRTEQITGRFAESSGNDFSPRVALNYNPTDSFSAYASVSKGYKPGGGAGNPDSGLGIVSEFGKETLWNYEVGANAYLADRRVRVSGALFFMDWKDFQIIRRETLCLFPDGSTELVILVPDLSVCSQQLQVDRTTNAPKARSKGAEFSIQALVVEGLQVGGGLGYLDANYVKGTTVVGGQDFDLAGIRLGSSPKWTASANAQYDFQAFGGDTFVGGTWSYRSSAAQGLIAQAIDRFPTKVDSFSLVNLRAGKSWDNHSIVLNVDNVLNKEYFTATEGFSFGGAMLSYNPRTWTVRWTAKFGS